MAAPLTALAAPGPADLERAIRAVERGLDLRICVHDLAGALVDAAGEPLLPPDRYAHSQPFCHDGGGTVDGGERCRAHCYGAVHRALAATPVPAVHRCWKGGSEVVVPLLADGVHVATLFAGVARADAAPTGLPPAARALWRRLPALEPARMPAVAAALTVLGEGLLAFARRLRASGDGGRGERILAYIDRHLAGPIRLGGLARHLGLSASRCSHVVRERLGQPFQVVVRARRIARAQALLVATPLSVRAVGERVGLGAEACFHRAFRRAVGASPGAWRRRERQRDGRGEHRLPLATRSSSTAGRVRG